MGLLFVAGQFYEFTRSGLQVSGQVIGAVFFALMTFHALHVLAGIFLLVFNLARSRMGDFSSTRYEPVIISAWFWYYVCAVWLVLFGALYLL
jgi:heme/copper-type cytochrome/quinol oxidase subunit 3